MPADELGGFFDREQILGGAPAKRAAALLFLIETRTARLVAQSRQRLERSLSEDAGQERSLAFVEAFALAREKAIQPTVHDLERQAERWAPLVPRNARLQAALARRIGEKYRFTARVAPGIRSALGLDESAVRAAHQTLFGEPIESVFAARLTLRERFRWTWTAVAKQLEALPPFWTAYSLTLTETLGASILALPIALATLGPLPGVAILVVLGLVNVLTVALMAEAVVRSGPMRYGSAFLGRLVEGYLGRRGSLGLSVLLGAFSFIALPVYYVGVGATLEDSTSVPAVAWVAALFLVTLVFVRRGSLNATVATALAVGAVNLLLVLVLSGLAFAHTEATNLLQAEVPFTGGRAFDASVVSVVFGVVLMAYFGHLSAVMCGSLVLERDPGGRSLIRGCAGAQATAVALYCLFVLAVNGAVGVGAFAGETGTALGPLAQVAGIGVDLVGVAFVILALGMVSLIEALSLVRLVQERIPSLTPRVVVLPRRRAHLVFRARGDRLRAGVTYLGLGRDGPRFSFDLDRNGGLEHSEIVASARSELLSVDESGRHHLALEVVGADERRARVAVTTTLRMTYEGELDHPGFDLAEALDLSDAEAAIVASLARDGEASAAAVAARLGRSEPETLAMLEALGARGVVSEKQTSAGPRFAARMAPRRARQSTLWNALVDDAQSPPATAAGTRPSVAVVKNGRAVFLGRRGRFVVSVLPLVGAFVLAEWFVVTGAGSFAGLLSFLGVIVVSLLAGLYPVLLFIASRRKGEYAPAAASGWLGRPALLVGVYLLFVAALFAHALVIWDDPVERVSAFAAGVAMLAIPAVLLRTGAFARRLTIELRDDQRDGRAGFRIVSGGEPIPGDVRLAYGAEERRSSSAVGEIPDLASLRRAFFEPRPDASRRADELKVWAHRVTPEGESESLPAQARLRSDGDVRVADVALTRGEAVFALDGADPQIEIVLKGLDEG
jgi:amino acid permease